MRQLSPRKNNMQKAHEPIRFEQFPRGYLSFKIGRRNLLPALLNNLHQFASDVPAFGLAELGVWEDEQLGEVVSKVIKGTQIFIDDGKVFAQPNSAEDPIEILTMDSPALFIFNLINGKTTLNKIAEKAAEENHWDSDFSFKYTRGVFLWMVLCRVCEPLYPKSTEEA